LWSWIRRTGGVPANFVLKSYWKKKGIDSACTGLNKIRKPSSSPSTPIRIWSVPIIGSAAKIVPRKEHRWLLFCYRRTSFFEIGSP
jgi:hypothetical protein